VAAADVALTRSRIEAFDQTADVLSGLAQRLRGGGPVVQQAGDTYVEQMRTPNATGWHGKTATRFLQEAHPDQESVNRAVDHANAMADVAERGGDYLRGARESVLEAITQAEGDEFTVGEDLSVTDNFVWGSSVDRIARQQAAVAHRDFIGHWAGRLQTANTSIAAQLHAGAAEMTAMTPAHWRQPAARDGATPDGKGKVQAVGHGWKQDPPGQARADYEQLKNEIIEHNASPPSDLSNKAAVDAYNAEADQLNARRDALEARLGVSEVVPARKQRLVPDWAHSAPPTPPQPQRPLDITTPHARALGLDPANGGRFRPDEAETGLRVEAQRGITLERSPHPGIDWIDGATGKSYDAIGNFDGRYLNNMDEFLGEIERHVGKADYVPVDVSQFSAEQRSDIRRFVSGLGPKVFIVGDYGSGG
jgi:CdiA C-terminal tRNase domain